MKLYCKMGDFFRSFFIALKLSDRKSVIKKKNFDDVHWKEWANIKMLYPQNNIKKKKKKKFKK